MRPLALVLAVAVGVAGSGYIPAVSQTLTNLVPKDVLTQFAGDLPLQQVTLSINVLAGIASLLLLAYALLPSKPNVYVLDFSVHAHDPSWRFPRNRIRPLAEQSGKILPEHVDFLEKIAYRTGLGDDTAVVPAIQSGDMTQTGMEAARFEFAATCFSCVEELLQKTGVKASQINFVITNSSLFNPTPSLSTTIMNHFKMGGNTKGYSLGGMGCSAGVIAIDLAREMLELYPNSYALVVSHENITNAFYAGKDPSMLLINCLFRANGAAVLLTNKPRDTRRSKYWVKHIVRTNLAKDDVAFNCVMQTEDEEKLVGVRLTKDIVGVGTRALQGNMTKLGPKVLPISEQLLFAGNMVTRQLARSVKPLKSIMPAAWSKPYIPAFKKAFDFYCIHTGGRGIIDGLEKELKLTRPQVEPSRASLFRFGNTSSTSVWYELAYIETFQGVAAGKRVWQLAFGSGFKFNSSVMIANKSITTAHKAWEGFDVAAMWVELDQLEASAKAARAAKAAKAAAAAAGETAAEAAPAAPEPEAVPVAAVREEEETVFAKPGFGGPADGEMGGSAFEAPDIAEKISDQDRPASFSRPLMSQQFSQQYSQRPLMSSRSIRRMPSMSQRNSLVAIGSGCVPEEDLQHLQQDVDVEVIEEGDEAMQ
uniref:Very-long-chain 3-oxoacyl-CoA synthase n=1 Tax=Tetradesmus obliquus TaxID=3088 RepID=A0A383WBH3_TETOB|eukprot:jgi/Sobl393_1/10519/SZX70063.1